MHRAELAALTGIRFYAALLVFLYHVPQTIPGLLRLSEGNTLFNGGDAGVAFFFVLSGFVLTYNYADVFAKGISTASYKRFIWARLTKIYPVHLLTLLMVLPIALLSPQHPLDWRAVPFHLTLMQCFWPSATPAFSDYLNKPSWSISCEWFFYLLAPIAMFFAMGNRRRWVPVLVAAVCVFGLGVFLWRSQSDVTRLYFVSRFAPLRFVEFLAGVFLASLFLTSSGRRLAALSGYMQAAGVALIVAAAFYGPSAPWPLRGGGLIYAPGSLLLILGLAYGRGSFAAHLSCPMLKYLGTASFSLYMIHQPVLRVVRGICLYVGWTFETWPAFWGVMVLTFVVAQGGAFLLCYGFEIPVQGWLRRVDRSSGPIWRWMPKRAISTRA